MMQREGEKVLKERITVLFKSLQCHHVLGAAGISATGNFTKYFIIEGL